MSRAVSYLSLATVAMLLSNAACADGTVVDRLYDPYVQPLEREIEFRTLVQRDDEAPDIRRHLVGFGRALSDRVAVELYAIGSTGAGQGLAIDASEIELKWQLTEQGEYAVDWGLLFELEREFGRNVWEASTSLLAGRDFGRWTAIANLDFIYEWGGGLKNEFETTLHLQARYRYAEVFEPGFEFHAGQNTLAAGPVISGLVRIAAGKKIRWSAGLFAGLDRQSPENTFRLNLEYEF